MKSSKLLCTIVLLLGEPLITTAQDQNPAMNNPSLFAWSVFVDVNRPANNGTNDAVWETWAEQEDVYGDPNKTPTWPGNAHQPKSLRPSIQQQLLIQENLLQKFHQFEMLSKEGLIGPPIRPQFIPTNPASEEVRMNKSSFDFIVAHELWYLQGQLAVFRNGTPVQFPVEAKEMKAQWKEITPAEKPKYHWQIAHDGKLYGLYAFHIMTKDVPNWIWATWEHVDNPDRCKVLPCSDTFGVSPDGSISQELLRMLQKGGLGSEWQNYRLDGVQVGFTDSTGRATLLGNSVIERGFVSTSSCMTCHSRAGIDANGGRLDIFLPSGQSYNGTTDPTWFYQPSANRDTMKYLQLDFVWSLFNAQARKVAPAP